MSTKDIVILTVPYAQLVKPFSKINVCFLPTGNKEIRAYLSFGHHPDRSGSQTGVAIEGSKRMQPNFGFKSYIGPLLVRQTRPNMVSMVAGKVCSYLARKLDQDKATTIIYWGTGSGGSETELIGDLTAFQSEQYNFSGPKVYGSKAKLLPAIHYFNERFLHAKWGMYVFLTQGKIDDLDAVKEYTKKLAKAITSGQRNGLKFVLIGMGCKLDVSYMEQLDHLNTGTELDLWDYKIAAEMRDVIEIFAEVVDKNRIIADTGRILDPTGKVIMTYDKGVPALLKFELPQNVRFFSLEIGDGRIVQPI